MSAAGRTIQQMGSVTGGTDETPEQVLLARARAGDEGAFGVLIIPYLRELHVHCYRMLESVHDAEDVLQEVLMRAWRHLDSFDGRGRTNRSGCRASFPGIAPHAVPLI